MRNCPKCKNATIKPVPLIRAALIGGHFHCSECFAILELKIGSGPNFLSAFIAPILFLLAALAGIATESWTVFVVIWIGPTLVAEWLYSRYCRIVEFGLTVR